MQGYRNLPLPDKTAPSKSFIPLSQTSKSHLNLAVFVSTPNRKNQKRFEELESAHGSIESSWRPLQNLELGLVCEMKQTFENFPSCNHHIIVLGVGRNILEE